MSSDRANVRPEGLTEFHILGTLGHGRGAFGMAKIRQSLYECVSACMYARVSMCVCTHMCLCMCIYMYVPICVHVYICTCTLLQDEQLNGFLSYSTV